MRQMYRVSGMRISGLLVMCVLVPLLLLLVTYHSAHAQSSGVVGACMGPQNCTANDGGFSGFDVVSGPSSCMEGDQVTFLLNAKLNGIKASDRYDVGIWVALNGLSPQQPISNGNVCYRDILTPLAPATPLNLTGGYGGFRDLDGDACGDASKNEANFKVLSPITIPCTDSNGDGILDVNACSSYKQPGQNDICNSAVDGIFPGSGPKCDCGTVQIGQVDVRQRAYI